MANLKYDKEITALLVIDPYNDFISEGGKLWDRLKGVAEANHCVPGAAAPMNTKRQRELNPTPLHAFVWAFRQAALLQMLSAQAVPRNTPSDFLYRQVCESLAPLTS